MKPHTQHVPSSFNLFLFGDLHFGTILHYDKGVDTLFDMMHSEYEGCKANYGLNHGDTIEAIAPDDPRFDPHTTKDAFVLSQVDFAENRLRQIRPLLIGNLKGNHEHKVWRFGDVAQKISNGLTVPYLTYTTKITYQDRYGELFKHFASHGFGSINYRAGDVKRQKTNEQVKLKDLLKKKAGDCCLMSMGHTHKLIINDPQPELYLTDDAKELYQNYTEFQQNGDYIHPDNRYYVNTGSFYRLYSDEPISGYAEMAGYDPIELGFVVATIRDRELTGIKKIIV